MLHTLILLANEAAGAAPDGPTPAQTMMSMIIPMAALCILGYLMMIRPMQRQERDRQNMVAALKKNDRVLTSGGLIGVIAAIKDKEDELTLRVDDNGNVRVRVIKSSIVRVLNLEESPKEAKAD